MPPKKAGEEVEPLEEDKDLLEKELVISYLKSKLAAYVLRIQSHHADYIDRHTIESTTCTHPLGSPEAKMLS